MSTAGEVWRCVFDIAPTYLLELFILTSAYSDRQSLHSASRGDFVVTHAIKQHRTFSTVGPSALNSALFRGFCRAPFTSSLSYYFRPDLGWERLQVVTLKWLYISLIYMDGWMDG